MNLRELLLVVPCTKKKTTPSEYAASGTRIASCLPAALAERLSQARLANRDRAKIDEQALVPAWQRYDGGFYQSAHAALGRAVEEQLHVLILSGGYGVLLAGEPIGCYNVPLNRCWWPGCVLEDVLAGYAQHHQLKCMRAFIPAKEGYRPYREIVKRVDWLTAGVIDHEIVTPDDGRRAGVEFATLLVSDGKNE